MAEHATGELSGSSVALDALADIDMLADADMFVLLFRSCFARVACKPYPHGATSNPSLQGRW